MAITFINTTAADITASASTWSIEVHSSRVGGGAYIVGIGTASSGVSVSSVGDNLGTQFSKASTMASPRDDVAEMWYLTNISSASTRVHVGLSAASSGGLAIAHFNGLSTANALRAFSGSENSTGNQSTHSAAQITPDSTSVVVTFSRLVAGAGATTPGANFTEWLDTGVILRSYGQYWIQTDNVATEGPWTGTSNTVNAQVMAAFADTFVAAAAGVRRSNLLVLGAS